MRAAWSPARKSSAMRKACARPSGRGCTAYWMDMPQGEPSPSSREKDSESSGVVMTRTSRRPAAIERGQRVVDHRLVVDGQQLLAHAHGDRPEPAAGAPARMIPFMRGTYPFRRGSRPRALPFAFAQRSSSTVTASAVLTATRRRVRRAWSGRLRELRGEEPQPVAHDGRASLGAVAGRQHVATEDAHLPTVADAMPERQRPARRRCAGPRHAGRGRRRRRRRRSRATRRSRRGPSARRPTRGSPSG